MLHDYLECLGEADLIEGKYELSQTMPKKVYQDMAATLESESLFPKALVQVGLIDQ